MGMYNICICILVLYCKVIELLRCNRIYFINDVYVLVILIKIN